MKWISQKKKPALTSFLVCCVVTFITVDYLTVFEFCFPWQVVAVGLVDMAIEPELRSVFHQELFKTVKTLMRIVIHIAIASDRGVGNDDIDTAVFTDLAFDPSDPSFHFLFAELIFTLGIT